MPMASRRTAPRRSGSIKIASRGPIEERSAGPRRPTAISKPAKIPASSSGAAGGRLLRQIPARRVPRLEQADPAPAAMDMRVPLGHCSHLQIKPFLTNYFQIASNHDGSKIPRAARRRHGHRGQGRGLPMTIEIEWQDYDVIVVGSGGSGGQAARARRRTPARMCCRSRRTRSALPTRRFRKASRRCADRALRTTRKRCFRKISRWPVATFPCGRLPTLSRRTAHPPTTVTAPRVCARQSRKTGPARKPGPCPLADTRAALGRAQEQRHRVRSRQLERGRPGQQCRLSGGCLVPRPGH